MYTFCLSQHRIYLSWNIFRSHVGAILGSLLEPPENFPRIFWSTGARLLEPTLETVNRSWSRSRNRTLLKAAQKTARNSAPRLTGRTSRTRLGGPIRNFFRAAGTALEAFVQKRQQKFCLPEERIETPLERHWSSQGSNEQGQEQKMTGGP